jgi:hypothetical protein
MLKQFLAQKAEVKKCINLDKKYGNIIAEKKELQSQRGQAMDLVRQQNDAINVLRSEVEDLHKDKSQTTASDTGTGVGTLRRKAKPSTQFFEQTLTKLQQQCDDLIEADTFRQRNVQLEDVEGKLERLQAENGALKKKPGREQHRTPGAGPPQSPRRPSSRKVDISPCHH